MHSALGLSTAPALANGTPSSAGSTGTRRVDASPRGTRSGRPTIAPCGASWPAYYGEALQTRPMACLQTRFRSWSC